MTVSVSFQRSFSPYVQANVSVAYQRMFVPFVLATGVSVSQQRLFVPFIDGGTPITGRRRQMMFQP